MSLPEKVSGWPPDGKLFVCKNETGGDIVTANSAIALNGWWPTSWTIDIPAGYTAIFHGLFMERDIYRKSGSVAALPNDRIMVGGSYVWHYDHGAETVAPIGVEGGALGTDLQAAGKVEAVVEGGESITITYSLQVKNGDSEVAVLATKNLKVILIADLYPNKDWITSTIPLEA